MKYGGLTLGQVEAIINKLGGENGARKFLRGELMVGPASSKWREQDSTIFFSVTSDGATGPNWISRLAMKDFRVGDWAKDILLSKKFKPTSGVVTQIAVLKGGLFSEDERITRNIYEEAEKRGLEIPNVEAACLIREKFSDEELEKMGLSWIFVMHDPIEVSDSGKGLGLLYVGHDEGGRWLNAYCAYPCFRWTRAWGFAFAVP